MSNVTRRHLIAGTSAVAASSAATTGFLGAGTALAQGKGNQGKGKGNTKAPKNDPVFGSRIDMHCHFIPPKYRTSLITHGYGIVGGVPLPQWSPERALEFMGRYGIGTQVLAISDPGVSYLPAGEAVSMARYINDYAADLVEKYPTRFSHFAVLPMPHPGAAAAEAKRALTELKADGVVLLSNYDGRYLADPAFLPLYKVLNDLGAYVFIHPGHVRQTDKPELLMPDFMTEYPFDTTRTATQLMFAGILDRFPHIRWQLSHAGGTLPFLAHRIGLASKVVTGTPLEKLPVAKVADYVSRFYYDTALSPSKAQMAATLAVAPLEHIVAGTDWPFSAATLQASGDPQPELNDTFDAKQRLKVERTNALAVLPGLRARLR